MNDYQKDISRLLADSGALKFGRFTLRERGENPYFLNLGEILNDAEHFMRLSNAYAARIKGEIDKGLEITTLFGPAYKAIALAVGTQQALLGNYRIILNVVYDRKEAKIHGERGSFIGTFPENARVGLIDDVISSGRTKNKAIEKIKSLGRRDIKVVRVFVAFDREQKNLEGRTAAFEFEKETGISVSSILKARETLRFLFESRHPVIVNGKKQPISPDVYYGFLDYLENQVQ